MKSNKNNHFKIFNRLLLIGLILIIIILFLPWTQNVSGQGNVTTLSPDKRPQTIQSQIPGKIEKWFVKEGDFVNKGDTILHISEIKTEYQDPNLVTRTEEQRDAKELSLKSYAEKIKSLETQAQVLANERDLKIAQAKNLIEQTRFMVISDSSDLVNYSNNFEIAKRQYERIEQLEKEGLKSRTDVEEKSLQLQESRAKVIAQENKLLTTKNRLSNAITEISRIKAEYNEKIAKTLSDKASSESMLYDTQAQVSKLNNQSTNYSIRQSLYFITAPQDGYINKTLKSGVGETIKEGDQLVGIMPANYDIAVEAYIEPIDLPLINLGESVRLQFDGWPSIFFSGWPNASYGTFAGKIVAVETFISPNGKYRILIAPDNNEQTWPENLRVGTGAYTIALLDNVPIWFELWRKLNGFPPNYYQPQNAEKKS